MISEHTLTKIGLKEVSAQISTVEKNFLIVMNQNKKLKTENYPELIILKNDSLFGRMESFLFT